jgi:hypothetical protein
MIKKLRVLDLFCCGGGAARGYAKAGFDIVGVDIEDQPQYPFTFVLADALEYVFEKANEFDLIHASPPCQGYSTAVSSSTSKWVPTLGKDEPKLIAPLREILNAAGIPYIIENVAGARGEMLTPVMLCGTMFGLPIPRHRLFECSWPLPQPVHGKCRGVAKDYAAKMEWEYRDMSVTGKGRRAGTATRWKHILGIDASEHMTQHQLAECIPPAFTEYIGNEFLKSNTLHSTY